MRMSSSSSCSIKGAEPATKSTKLTRREVLSSALMEMIIASIGDEKRYFFNDSRDEKKLQLEVET